MLRHLLLVFVVLASGSTWTPGRAETRVGLVVGNSAYVNTARLPNPRNDAEAVAAKLGALGFQVVAGYDRDHRQTRELLRQFGTAAAHADVSLFYYAGHAVQVYGENYLLPVDSRLRTERDLKYEGIPLEWAMDELSRARKLRLAILDACRDNPLAETMARSMGSRSAAVGRGLALLAEVPTLDTLIAYATRADDVAEDGPGDHSPFTAALLKHIDEPGLDVRLMFGRIRDTVLEATRNRQEPFIYGSMGGNTWAFREPLQDAPATGESPPRRPVSDALAY